MQRGLRLIVRRSLLTRLIRTQTLPPRATSLSPRTCTVWQQRRHFWLLDTIRTTIQPTNPLLDALERIQTKEGTPDTARNLQLMNLEPKHLRQATQQMQEQYDKEWSRLEENVDKLSLSELMERLEELETPLRWIWNIQNLFWHVKQTPDFKKAIQTQDIRFAHEHSHILYQALEQKLNISQEGSPDHVLWAARHLLEGLRERGIHRHDDNVASDIQHALEEAHEQLDPYPEDFLALSKPHQKAVVGILYQNIGLQNHWAQTVLGLSHFAEQVLQSRMATLEEIHSLHARVRDRLVTATSTTSEEESEEEEADDYELIKALANERVDVKDHFTLEGVLNGLFELSEALFGVHIRKDDQGATWDLDVQLYHVYDTTEEEQSYLGSFYLDPFEREHKLKRDFVGSLWERSQGASPLAYLVVQLTPGWNHLPTDLESWENLESLVHEFGHVLQMILARPGLGGITGAHNIPLDVSEVVPQFMEHWLWNVDFLQNLTVHSEKERLTDSKLEKLHQRYAARRKHQFTHRLFFGALELEIYSTFDPRGDGPSLLERQRELAETCIPHDMPSPNDLSPVLMVVKKNCDGMKVAEYRYLWSEALSAALYEKFVPHWNDAKTTRRLGMDFRRQLLDPGAMVDTKSGFKKLGIDDVSPEALFRLYRF